MRRDFSAPCVSMNLMILRKPGHDVIALIRGRSYEGPGPLVTHEYILFIKRSPHTPCLLYHLLWKQTDRHPHLFRRQNVALCFCAGCARSGQRGDRTGASRFWSDRTKPGSRRPWVHYWLGRRVTYTACRLFDIDCVICSRDDISSPFRSSLPFPGQNGGTHRVHEARRSILILAINAHFECGWKITAHEPHDDKDAERCFRAQASLPPASMSSVQASSSPRQQAALRVFENVTNSSGSKLSGSNLLFFFFAWGTWTRVKSVQTDRMCQALIHITNQGPNK